MVLCATQVGELDFSFGSQRLLSIDGCLSPSLLLLIVSVGVPHQSIRRSTTHHSLSITQTGDASSEASKANQLEAKGTRSRKANFEGFLNPES